MTNTTRIDIAANERGMIRIFAIDLPMAEAETLVDPDADWSLHMALGAGEMDYAHVDLLNPADLGDIGLAGYLSEGIGLPADALAEDAAMLNGIDSPVVVISSNAFAGQPARLTPTNPLRWIATYKNPAMPVTFEPLPDESAKGPVQDAPTKKAPSDAAMSGRVAMVVLIVLGLLVWLMIWIAG